MLGSLGTTVNVMIVGVSNIYTATVRSVKDREYVVFKLCCAVITCNLSVHPTHYTVHLKNLYQPKGAKLILLEDHQ